MPVDSTHKQYEAHEADWEKIRDVLAGERAVKSASTKYLPMLGGFDSMDYTAYKARAMFFEAAPRTVSGLVGAMFRKDPVVEAPERLADDMVANITLTGVSLKSFSKTLAEEVLAMGRVGVLVDFPDDVAGQELRPYARFYEAEDIINWRVDNVGGVPRLGSVILREAGNDFSEDPYEPKEIKRLRELTFGFEIDRETGEIAASGRFGYIQVLWEKRLTESRKEEWVVVDTIMPVREGAALDFIPFRFIGPTTLDPDVERSPILGLVNVNLSHYITSADLEHGAHFTALPTPWASGVEQQSNLRIGSGTAWTLPDGASAGMLEYTGRGLDALEKRLERKEHSMAVLGARLLEDQKAGGEAAETVRLRHSGENSVLSGIADTVGQGMSDVLSWMIWWSGGQEDAAMVEINQDFVSIPMGPNELMALIKGWQAGAYPKSVLRYNLRQGELIPPEMTDEELDAELALEEPLGLAMPSDTEVDRENTGEDEDEGVDDQR